MQITTTNINRPRRTRRTIPPTPVTVTPYNMHGDMSALNRKIQPDGTADALHDLRSDVFFLQEVQGRHQTCSDKMDGLPGQPRYNFLGEQLSYNHSYGKNAVYPQRHHGNIVLSRLPTEVPRNLNITVNHLEQRGVLHCEVLPEGWEASLTYLYTHLNLREPNRTKQYCAIFKYVSMHVDPTGPLIIIGDFNDWHEKSTLSLGKALNLNEIFIDSNGCRPKTLPSRTPFLSLDYVYTRSSEMLDAQIHNGKRWQHLSDHLLLGAKVRPKLKLPRQTI